MNWYKTAQKNECKGWTCVRMDSPTSKKIQQWGKNNIPQDELTGDGFETDTHITILYGICTKNRDIIKNLFAKEKPVKAKLGKIGCFVNNDEFDVVIIKIDSTDLERLHNKIKNELNVNLTHDQYKPHCTIAYVKKGKARKYAGENIFEEKSLTFNKIIFKDGSSQKETIVHLNG